MVNSECHQLKELTKGKIENIFKKSTPIHGIYLFSDDVDNALYVGRSRNIQVRIGVDHRATGKSQANLTYKISKDLKIPLLEAREYMFDNFNVRMIEVENDNARYLFEVYAAIKLNTPYNSFREA